jgi:UDP-xylose/UDP-N-acetylglucosamine transporter B4
MCLQTLLGEMQSRTSTQFGKAGDESTFFMHLLSVPVLFLLVTGTSSPPFLTFDNINERLLYWSSSPPAMIEFTRMANIAGKESISLSSFFARFGASIISFLGLGQIPVMYIFVGLNVITQYIGITGVYQLVEVCDPLTVNVLLTVRKAISVVASILLFGNTFTIWHCLGAIIVFSSSILWAKIPKAVLVEPSPLLKVIETRRGRRNKTQALIVDVAGDREEKVGNGKTPTIESSSINSSSSRSQSKSPRNKKRRD